MYAAFIVVMQAPWTMVPWHGGATLAHLHGLVCHARHCTGRITSDALGVQDMWLLNNTTIYADCCCVL